MFSARARENESKNLHLSAPKIVDDRFPLGSFTGAGATFTSEYLSQLRGRRPMGYGGRSKNYDNNKNNNTI
jgi:hypothetical protein